MTDYLKGNTPSALYQQLLSVGNAADHVGLTGTLKPVWTDDGAGSKNLAPFSLSTAAMRILSTTHLEFFDAGIYIYSSSDGKLNLVSDGEIDLAAADIDLNATTSLEIDNTNTTNGVKIGTNVNGMPITIGHTTSETTVGDNLTVTGTAALNDVITVATGKKLQFVDSGEYISGDGTDLTIGSGADISLTPTANVNIVGTSKKLTFAGNDGNYISVDGSNQMTVEAVAKIDVTAGSASTWKTSDGTLTIFADGADDKVHIKGDNASGVAVDIEATHIDGDIKIKAGSTSGIIDIDSYDFDMDIGGGGIDIVSGAQIDMDTSAGDIRLDSRAGSVLLDGGETGQTAITLQATHTDGGIRMIAGTSGLDLDTTGNVDITSSKNGANAIYIEADGGVSETIKIHSNQGTGAASIELTSDVGGMDINADLIIDIDSTGTGGTGGVYIDSADTTNGIKIGVATSGVPITIGHATSEVTVADNLTVSGDCAVTGTLTSGTFSPSAITLTHASDPALIIYNQEESDTQNDRHGKLIFQGETFGGTVHQLASIIADHDSSDADKDGGLYFYTNDGADADNALTERLYLDHAGNAQFSTDIGIPATSKLYLDGKSCSGNTYLYEKAADEVVLVCGGTEIRMADNTGGTNNTIYGRDAGLSLDSSSNWNTFVGSGVADAALSNADHNVGVGYKALSELTTGDYNTGVGSGSLNALTSGMRNAGFGYYSLRNLATGIFNTALGTSALYNADGCDYNTAGGYEALKGVTTGDKNTAFGAGAGDAITTGSNNTVIGFNCDVDLSSRAGTVCIGNNHTIQTASDNIVEIGNATNYMKYDLDSGDITITSDRRVKKNIVETNLGLDFVNSLKPVKYNLRPNKDFAKAFGISKEHIVNALPEEKADKVFDGLIAQDVKKVMDDLGVDFSGWEVDSAGRQRLGYSNFIAPLIKAVQELSAEVEALKG